MTDWSRLSTCDTPGCTGHLGKYPSCLAEAMDAHTLDGWADDTTGDSDYQGHFAKVTLDDPYALETFDGRSVVAQPGTYIVETGSSGAVCLHTFTPEQRDEAERLFAEYDEAYSAWLDQEDED